MKLQKISSRQDKYLSMGDSRVLLLFIRVLFVRARQANPY